LTQSRPLSPEAFQLVLDLALGYALSLRFELLGEVRKGRPYHRSLGGPDADEL
jgi:hypothetical protein